MSLRFCSAREEIKHGSTAMHFRRAKVRRCRCAEVHLRIDKALFRCKFIHLKETRKINKSKYHEEEAGEDLIVICKHHQSTCLEIRSRARL